MDQGSFPKILAVAAIVLNEEKTAVLLHKRHKEPDLGKWEIFAGYVEPGERLTNAVRRKLREKAGVEEVKKIEFTGRYYDDPSRHPGLYCIHLVFTAIVDRSTMVENENIKWFPVEEITGLDLSLDNKEMIKDNLRP